MDKVFCNRHHARRILREIVMLRKLKHHYIIDIVDIIQPEDPKNFDSVYLVLELAEKDMRKLIESDLYLTLEHVKVLIYKLLCCMKFLHSAKIIHRDIKPANILIANSYDHVNKKPNDPKDWKIKICDFGLARSLAGVSSATLFTNPLGQASTGHYHEDSETHSSSHHSSATHQQEQD
jgi:mitogen-activated protein kinase 1/3